jgi:multiple sugar transport system substrate-binding protein
MMKKVLILLFALIASFALSACKKTDDKKIIIALEATGDIPEKFQEQIDRFTEETGIEVEIQTYAGADNYEKAILGQIAGKQAPDVFWTDGGVKLREYAEAEAIQPLDDLVTMDLDNFEQSLLDAFEYDGKLYGIPKDYNTTVLFYNEDY